MQAAFGWCSKIRVRVPYLTLKSKWGEKSEPELRMKEEKEGRREGGKEGRIR